MIGLCPLASGSKGNAIYIGTSKTKILIDAGLSLRALQQKLQQLNVDLADLDAIVITHEHIDHIRGLAKLSSQMKIPIFANADTARAIYEVFGEGLKFKIFSTGEKFAFGDLEFDPFTISHDAVDPVGFTIQIGFTKIGVCADLGFATPLVVNKLQGCGYLYIEANHQEEMVHACSRSYVYKQRVLSRLGHLSNRQSAELLQAILHSGLQHVYLAHLSSECNNPELAKNMICQMLEKHQMAVNVSIAYQEDISHRVYF